MPGAPQQPPEGKHPADQFRTTHWGLVAQAGEHESAASAEALETLCRAYWYPLYAYVRRKGHDATESQDLIQEFFARFLASHSVRSVDRRKGRFRSFLLGSMEHFLAKQWNHARRLKRGGGLVIFSLDDDPEQRYGLEPADEMTPERIFERRWALLLLENSMSRLRLECAEKGKADLFDRAKSLISGDRASEPYADLATVTRMTEGALRVAVHRLRQRYGELLRDEIAQTVSSPEEFNVELRALFAALG